MLKFISITLLAFLVCSKITINTSNRQFTDENGRQLLFHGVNAVYKVFPFYPTQDKFDPFNSLVDEDYQKLRSWGFNFIRLYMSWQGAEPEQGQYNTTYIEQVRNIVRKAAEYNITVLLDAHQDVMNRKFCGEGMPDWAIKATNFPAPLKINFTFDSHGYPNLTQCLQREFAEYYITENVQKEWENFYKNVDNIQDHMAAFWAQVAGIMKDEQNVIGYEIVNEPFSADFYVDPSSIVDPSKDDHKYLEPFYERVHNKVRTVDNDTILFFEPIVNDIYKVGLKKGPGGPEWNDKQALSYHVYCGLVNGNGEPDSKLVCHGLDTEFMNTKHGNAVKIGVASFLTEFGALSNSEKSSDELDYLLELADKKAQSWSYWQYKYYQDYTTASNPSSTESFYNEDGSLQMNKIKHLSRTYIYATCGETTKMSFDPATSKFEATIKVSQKCNGLNSELFASKEFYYPDGLEAEFKHCDGCQVNPLSEENYYEIVWGSGVSEGTEVELIITQKKSSEAGFLDIVDEIVV